MRPSRGASPARTVNQSDPVSSVVNLPATSSAGECYFTSVCGSREAKDIIPTLKKVLAQLESPVPAPVKPVSMALAVGAAVFKEGVFCGISPLGTHVDD